MPPLLWTGATGKGGVISVNYDGFIDDVSVGDELLVDGGIMSFVVRDKSDTDVQVGGGVSLLVLHTLLHECVPCKNAMRQNLALRLTSNSRHPSLCGNCWSLFFRWRLLTEVSWRVAGT